MSDSLSNYSTENRTLSDSEQEYENITVVMQSNHIINQQSRGLERLEQKIKKQKQKIS